jgi:uridine kinase
MTAEQRTRKRITESNSNSSAVSWRRVVNAIARKRGTVSPDRAVLVGISGIDASGKGYFAAKIADRLQMEGLKVAMIGADGWLNLPRARFNPDNLAEHFYECGLRFDEMFEQVIGPLRNNRSINLDADHTEETALSYRKHRYEYRDVDVILLEGIFLLKRAHRHLFDLAVWVDCSFETALERAIGRGQEGLSPAETIKAFETIYFPAQRIHLARDNPQVTADILCDFLVHSFVLHNPNPSD